MRELPEMGGRDEFTALVIRTDYSDGSAWQAVLTELMQPSGEAGQFEAQVEIIDDPVWAEATPGDVITEVRRDETLGVVFLADLVTMRSADHALLACDVWAEDEDLDSMYYQELVYDPPAREFRAAPRAIHGIHANVTLGNLGVDELAEIADGDPGGVLRPL